MATSSDKNRIDMCTGALLPKIIRYSVPLFLTLVLQLAFNAADLIVVGRFANANALASVGATPQLINLMTNLFFGLSMGTTVLASNAFGAKDDVLLSKTTHTSMLLSLLCGFAMIAVGYVLSPICLRYMDTPEEVLPGAILYMRIYFFGMPAILVYNFGSAILRAIGDTTRPMLYLFIAGIINVPLNIVFVVYGHMEADGVAWATVISQCVSSFLVWRSLATANDACRLSIRKLSIHPIVLKRMLAIGLPAAAQGSCFSLSNVVIQSSVNSFGALAMAGNSAVVSLEGIVYMGSYTFHQTSLSFVGQNYGGRHQARIRRSILHCIWLTSVLTTVMGFTACIFGRQVVGIYTTDETAIAWGVERMWTMLTSYALCGIMDVISGTMRAIGYSLYSAVSVLLSVCAFRILWVHFVFQQHHTLFWLMICYPLSWLLADVINGGVMCILMHTRKYKRHFEEPSGASLQEN